MAGSRSSVRVAVVAVVMFVLTAASVAHGATLTVNTTVDDVASGDGHCSLRKAVESVDTPGTPSPDCATPSATGNTIDLGVPATAGPVVYALTVHPSGADDATTGDLNIAASVANLTIEGPGATQATIDASALNDRVVSIATGASVAITGVTITGGHAPNGASDLMTDSGAGGNGQPGGAILNQGTLTLNAVDVSGNLAGNGGTGGKAVGIIAGGTGGNGGAGGGIDNTGTLTVVGGAVTANHAGSGGSGGNTANNSAAGGGGSGGAGGGIASSGGLTLTNTSVSANFAGGGGAAGTPAFGVPGGGGGSGGAGGAGGAIASTAAALSVTGTTLDANAAGAGAPGTDGGTNGGMAGAGGNGGCGGDGGAIDATSGLAATIAASTISANHAGSSGAGGKGAIVVSSGTGSNGGKGCAGGNGGGVAVSLATFSVTDTTLTANFAGAGGAGGQGGGTDSGTGGKGGDAGGGGNGGGVFDGAAGTSTMLAATIFQNGAGSAGAAGLGGQPDAGGTAGANGAAGAAGAGGGIFVRVAAVCVIPIGCPQVSLADTIVASDAGSNCSGNAFDAANNLSFGDATCPGTSGDPKLGPLQDNGGPVQTSDLGPGSAAIDAGPAGGPNCPATDARGLPRPAGAACDIGAYEATAPAATTEGATAVTQTSATISAVVTPNAGSATVTFAFGTSNAYGSTTGAQTVAGLAAVPVSAALTGLTPGTTYHYQVVATSSDGTTHGADATFTTTAAAGGPGGPPPPKVAPKITHLRLASATFAAAGSGASVAKKRRAKTGTTITYTDSEAATTTFTLLRHATGVKSAKRCVAPPRHRRRGQHFKACTRLLAGGHFTHADKPGANTLHFTGRVAGHKLKAAQYTLSAVPKAGGLSGHAVSALFRISG
jgi:hypothetical protein